MDAGGIFWGSSDCFLNEKHISYPSLLFFYKSILYRRGARGGREQAIADVCLSASCRLSILG